MTTHKQEDTLCFFSFPLLLFFEPHFDISRTKPGFRNVEYVLLLKLYNNSGYFVQKYQPLTTNKCVNTFENYFIELLPCRWTTDLLIPFRKQWQQLLIHQQLFGMKVCVVLCCVCRSMQSPWQSTLFLTTSTFFHEPTFVGQQPDVITSSAAINYVRFRENSNAETKRLAWFFSPTVSMSVGELAVNPLAPRDACPTPESTFLSCLFHCRQLEVGSQAAGSRFSVRWRRFE